MSSYVSPSSGWRFGVLGFDSLHPLQFAKLNSKHIRRNRCVHRGFPATTPPRLQPSAHRFPTAIRLHGARVQVPNPPADTPRFPPSTHPRPSSPIRADTFRIRPCPSTSRAGRRGFAQPGHANNPVRPAPGCLHSFGMLGFFILPFHLPTHHCGISANTPQPRYSRV